jgi:hypothetical protein
MCIDYKWIRIRSWNYCARRSIWLEIHSYCQSRWIRLYLEHRKYIDLIKTAWNCVKISCSNWIKNLKAQDRNWRKTRIVNNGSTCIGVDVNRNFLAGFGGTGSSGDPCSNSINCFSIVVDWHYLFLNLQHFSVFSFPRKCCIFRERV